MVPLELQEDLVFPARMARLASLVALALRVRLVPPDSPVLAPLDPLELPVVPAKMALLDSPVDLDLKVRQALPEPLANQVAQALPVSLVAQDLKVQ